MLIHNAVCGAFGNFLGIDPKTLAVNFQVNTMPLLYLARRLTAAMGEAGKRAIVVSGNTSAQPGKPRFAGFAPTKAARRILAESIAREVGPKGVHVAYVMIDGLVDPQWTRAMTYKPAGDPFFVQSSATTEEIWHAVHQDRSARSFNVEVRPFRETW